MSGYPRENRQYDSGRLPRRSNRDEYDDEDRQQGHTFPLPPRPYTNPGSMYDSHQASSPYAGPPSPPTILPPGARAHSISRYMPQPPFPESSGTHPMAAQPQGSYGMYYPQDTYNPAFQQYDSRLQPYEYQTQPFDTMSAPTQQPQAVIQHPAPMPTDLPTPRNPRVIERRFLCEVENCSRSYEGRGFTTLNDLERHGRSKHGEDGQYIECRHTRCPDQGKKFPRRDNFIDHYIRVHANGRARDEVKALAGDLAKEWMVEKKSGDWHVSET